MACLLEGFGKNCMYLQVQLCTLQAVLKLWLMVYGYDYG